ncbi:DUF72 domain-containing protein [Streptomyces nogalater]
MTPSSTPAASAPSSSSTRPPSTPAPRPRPSSAPPANAPTAGRSPWSSATPPGGTRPTPPYDRLPQGPGRHGGRHGHPRDPAPGPRHHPRLTVIRFHGRSPHWRTGTKEERFRHTYTEQELEEWLPRIHTSAATATELHLLFNNCCGDAAPKAAETMRQLLTRSGLPHQRAATKETPTGP